MSRVDHTGMGRGAAGPRGVALPPWTGAHSPAGCLNKGTTKYTADRSLTLTNFPKLSQYLSGVYGLYLHIIIYVMQDSKGKVKNL